MTPKEHVKKQTRSDAAGSQSEPTEQKRGKKHGKARWVGLGNEVAKREKTARPNQAHSYRNPEHAQVMMILTLECRQ